MSTEAWHRVLYWTGLLVWMGMACGPAIGTFFPHTHFHLQAGSTEQMIAWHEAQAKKLKEQKK